MKPIDLMGLGPRRKVTRVDDGYVVTVTPPTTWSGFKASSLKLSIEQFSRYNLWLNTGVLIQEALPDLTAEQREILMTGIGPEEFNELETPEG